MIVLLVTLALGQAPCLAGDRIAAASESVARFDLPGAVAQLGEASTGCVDAEIARWYLRGLIAARDAYRFGGSAESLAPVNDAIDVLTLHAGTSAVAATARVVLMAASAAAQSERDVMALMLEQALRLEDQQRAPGSQGRLIVSAHEVAGDLWLQVHRYEDARRAYESAGQAIGRTGRVTLGLARAAARLKDMASACSEYRALVAAWPSLATAAGRKPEAAREPAELSEARMFLEQPACRTPPAVPAPR